VSIKNKLRALAPRWLRATLIEFLAFLKTVNLFLEDARYFISQSGVLSKQKKSRLAKIIKNYHKIEKGLTLHPRRYHFGEPVIRVLTSDIESATNDVNATDEELGECFNALSALDWYVQCHNENTSEFVTNLQHRVQHAMNMINDRNTKAYVNNSDAISLYSDVSDQFQQRDIELYDRVIQSRKSVRRFTSTLIERKIIDAAMNVALNTPSACNRQPWFVTHLGKKVDVYQALLIQKGNISLAENVNELLIVWMDVSRALSPEERGQHFFDGGLFSMNLANALNVRGVSSCFLNWAKSRKEDDQLRVYLKMPVNYKPVTFLAIGYADKDSIICRSTRKSVENSFASL
jgi:nitroreductase